MSMVAESERESKNNPNVVVKKSAFNAPAVMTMFFPFEQVTMVRVT